MERFPYVVARSWGEGYPEDHLCIYAYGNQIHYETLEDAKGLLDYILRNNPEKDYKIYRLRFEEVKPLEPYQNEEISI